MADVGIRIKATDEASGVFGKIAGEAGKLQGAVSAVSSGFAALGGVAAVATAGIGFASQIKDAIDLADSFNKLSQKTGVAVESLSKINYAAGLADVSTEALSTGFKKLNVSISAAAGGSAEKAAVFKALGVSIKDAAGNVQSADKVLAQLADSFAESGDTANKAAVAVELFGKAGTDLIPLLNAGSKGLNEMGDEAQKLGIVLGTEFAKNAEEFNDNLHKISVSGQGLFVTLAGDLVKGLGAAAKAASEAAIEGGKLAAVYAGLQALFTGDDMHKANVAMVQGVEVLMAAENALDKARATGDTARIERLTKAVALRKQELKVTQDYRAMLESDAKKREEDNKPKPTGDSKGIAAAAAAIAKPSGAAPKETGNAFAAEQDAAKEWAKVYEAAGKARDDLIAKNLDLGKSEAALKVYMESTAAAINEKTNPAMNDMVKAAYQANIALEAMGKLADVIEAQQRRTSTAQDETQKERERVAAIGLTTQAVAELGATRLEELAIAKERTLLAADEIDLSGELSEAIKGEVKALRERAGLLRTGAIKENAVEAAKASAEEWKRGWEQTDQIAREAFSSWAEDGSSAAKKIGDTLKKALLSAIYEATLKPLVMQVYTTVTGGSGVAGLVSGGQGGAGGIVNTASNLNSLYGAGSQFLYGGTAGASNASLAYANATQYVGGDGLGALIQGNGGWAGVSTEGAAAAAPSSTGALSGVGSSAMAFIPFLLAAYGAGKDSFRVSSTGDSTSQFDASGRVINRSNQLFGGDSPVVIPSIVNGVALANPQTPSSFTTNELALTDGRTQEQLDTLYAAQSATRDAQFAATNAAADKYTESLNAAYLAAARNLGVGAVSTNITFGTNDTRGGGGARLGLSAGSRQFDSGDIGLNDAELKLAASRAILTALEGSDLPAYMRGVFDGVDAAQLDQAGIDAAVQSATDLKHAYELLQTIPDQNLTDISYETLNSIKGMVDELVTVDRTFFALGYTLLDVSEAGAAAASGLASAFGGLANFQTQTAALYQNFYTAEEQKASAVRSASSTLSAAGITGFTNEDLMGASRAQIRAVVDQYATRIGTDQGDRQYAAVVSAANTLSSFVPAFEATNRAVVERLDGRSVNTGNAYSSDVPVQDAALSAWQDATDAIVRVMGDLRTTLVDSGPDSFTKLQAQFAIELASAKAGNLSAAEDLPALVQNLAQASKDQFTTSVQRDVFVARLIESLGDVVNVGSAGGNLSNPNYVAGGPQVPATVRTPPTYAYTAPSASSAPAVGADPSLLEEVKALRDELIAIRGSTSAIAISTGKSARILDASANGGQPLGTKVLT